MQDYFALIFEGMNKVLGQHSSFFESMGMNLFRSFGVILIVWYGIQSELSSAEGGPGFSWSRLAGIIQELCLVYTMLAFYTAPIPGLGISLTHLILDQAQSMVQQLDQSSVQNIIKTLNDVEMNLPYPTAFDIMGIFRFMVLFLAILAAQAVTLYVIMFGYVATAVLILLGPVFIPFKIVPQMDWLFWGWFRSFIQFAFYQVVASAYVFVFGDFLIQFFGHSSGPLSTSQLAYLMVPMVLVLSVFVLGTIKIPALTFSLFSGRSGDYVFLRWR